MSRDLGTWLAGTLDNFKLRSGYNDHLDPQAYVQDVELPTLGIQYEELPPANFKLLLFAMLGHNGLDRM